MKRSERGVVAIEAAILYPVFFTMMFIWLEVCYMAYVSSVGDYAIAEAAMEVKANYRRDTGTAAYESALTTALEETPLGTYFSDNFTVDVEYLDSDELSTYLYNDCGYEEDEDTGEIENTCSIDSSGDGDSQPVAVYHISYDYDPLFASLLFDNTITFDREVIVVQEYERCDFDTTGELTCD